MSKVIRNSASMKLFLCLCALLMLASITFPALNADAASKVKLTHGGYWKYKTVHNFKGDYRGIFLVQKVTYISPSVVRRMAFDLAQKVGYSKSKSAVSYRVNCCYFIWY